MSDEGPPDDRPGPDAAIIVFSIFLILAGLCLTLLGGSCTMLFISGIGGLFSWEAAAVWPLFILSLAVLAAGLGMIWQGTRRMIGEFRK